MGRDVDRLREGRGGMTAVTRFVREPTCWICDAPHLQCVGTLVFELSEYRRQDLELAAYSGERLELHRCRRCGFGQPEALPALPRYFDRMYDQRWSEDWIRNEFDATAKDVIFDGILRKLSRRLDPSRRRLLDVGAHAGRFVARAIQQGWRAEGLELNPQTASYAAARTGARIRQVNASDIDPTTEAFDVVTLTDVLEHMPRPLEVLRTISGLVSPGGFIAVKVPCGPAQAAKEAWRGRLVRGYHPTVADNLVHVSHFSPAALRLALEKAGFTDVTVRPGAPELPPGGGTRTALARALRLALFAGARMFPGGLHTPLALNLQAYARKP
jgi:SAM-dependent methyltransferase